MYVSSSAPSTPGRQRRSAKSPGRRPLISGRTPSEPNRANMLVKLFGRRCIGMLGAPIRHEVVPLDLLHSSVAQFRTLGRRTELLVKRRGRKVIPGPGSRACDNCARRQPPGKTDEGLAVVCGDLVEPLLAVQINGTRLTRAVPLAPSLLAGCSQHERNYLHQGRCRPFSKCLGYFSRPSPRDCKKFSGPPRPARKEMNFKRRPSSLRMCCASDSDLGSDPAR